MWDFEQENEYGQLRNEGESLLISIDQAIHILQSLEEFPISVKSLPSGGTFLIDGFHEDPSSIPVISDKNVLTLAQAATAIGYASWGTDNRKNNPRVVHEELVAAKHSENTNLLATFLELDIGKWLASVVTIVQAQENRQSRVLAKGEIPQPNVSIGFNDLVLLPQEITEQINHLKPKQIGELTLFTVLPQFRNTNLKKQVCNELFSFIQLRARELGLKGLFAIMPDFVSRLIPQGGWEALATTATTETTAGGLLLPKMRLLQPGDFGFEEATQVYDGYPWYWKKNTLQFGRIHL